MLSLLDLLLLDLLQQQMLVLLVIHGLRNLLLLIIIRVHDHWLRKRRSYLPELVVHLHEKHIRVRYHGIIAQLDLRTVNRIILLKVHDGRLHLNLALRLDNTIIEPVILRIDYKHLLRLRQQVLIVIVHSVLHVHVGTLINVVALLQTLRSQ
jgi:hypothetical protein